MSGAESTPMQAEQELENINVERIAPEGLGFGHGSISVQDRLESGDLDQATLDVVEGIVHSDSAMVIVDADDDGCPDGRKAAAMIMGRDRHTAPSHKHRPKVFGGGATMATAALIGNGAVDPSTETISEAFEYGIHRLENVGLNFGGHSAVKTADGKSGCGAIDEAPNIIKNIVRYREEIKGVIETLVDPEADKAELDGIMETAIDNFAAVSDTESSQEPTEEQQLSEYKGGSILSKFQHREKKIAELEGEHKEVAIVMNIDVDGMTFDQDRVRKETDDKAQVFAVDVPRMKDIADGMFEYDHDKKQALVSMLMYSLGTAATLTKGDLPVDVVYQGENRYIRL